MGFNVQDAKLKDTGALPASGGATAELAGIDLGVQEEFYAPCEFVIEAPSLNSTELPDGETVTYRVQESGDGESWSTLYDSVLVQTGASGSGADAAQERVRLPSDCGRYVRVQAETSTSTGDCSGSEVEESLRV